MSEKQKIVLAVGLPGAGKSTWLALQDANPISSDAIRLQLADNAEDQTIHARVFATVRYLLEQRLDLGRPVTYIDATSLTPAERDPYILIARAHKCEIEAVFFNVPLSVCKARNQLRRSRIVPEAAMDLMAAKLIPPTTDEGFDRITRITGA